MPSPKKPKSKKARIPNRVLVYKSKDGDHRYKYWKQGKVVDAATEGYHNRTECLKNLAAKFELMAALGTYFLRTHLGEKRFLKAYKAFTECRPPTVKVVDQHTGEVLNKKIRQSSPHPQDE